MYPVVDHAFYYVIYFVFWFQTFISVLCNLSLHTVESLMFLLACLHFLISIHNNVYTVPLLGVVCSLYFIILRVVSPTHFFFIVPNFFGKVSFTNVQNDSIKDFFNLLYLFVTNNSGMFAHWIFIEFVGFESKLPFIFANFKHFYYNMTIAPNHLDNY